MVVYGWLQSHGLLSWFCLPVAFLGICLYVWHKSVAFLGICSTFLEALNSWVLHCTFDFIHKTSSIIFSEFPHLPSNNVFLNMDGSLLNPITLAFCMAVKTTSMWMMVGSVGSGSSSQVSLARGCSSI